MRCERNWTRWRSSRRCDPAQVEQLARQVERLEAFQQVTREEFQAEYADLVSERSIDPGRAGSAGGRGRCVAARFDHSLLHAEARTFDRGKQLHREFAEVRSTSRLTPGHGRTCHRRAGDTGRRRARGSGDADAAAPPGHAVARPGRSYPTFPASSFSTARSRTATAVRRARSASVSGRTTWSSSRASRTRSCRSRTSDAVAASSCSCCTTPGSVRSASTRT